MQTIKLDISNNNIFNTIMDFLNNLPQNDFRVKVEQKATQHKKSKKLNAISLKTKGFKFDRETSHER